MKKSRLREIIKEEVDKYEAFQWKKDFKQIEKAFKREFSLPDKIWVYPNRPNNILIKPNGETSDIDEKEIESRVKRVVGPNEKLKVFSAGSLIAVRWS